jgi:hypothetical protein
MTGSYKGAFQFKFFYGGSLRVPAMRMEMGFCKAHFAQGMIMMGKLIIAAAVAMLVCVTAAGAQTAEFPNFSFNGFGTFGVVRSDEDQADFASGLFVPDGAGYTREWSPEVDSVLGLQLTADLTPRFTGILQVISEQRYDGTYTPTVEWANLTFDITPDLSIRGGRMVQQTFMVSEYRKVRILQCITQKRGGRTASGSTLIN